MKKRIKTISNKEQGTIILLFVIWEKVFLNRLQINNKTHTDIT